MHYEAAFLSVDYTKNEMKFRQLMAVSALDLFHVFAGSCFRRNVKVNSHFYPCVLFVFLTDLTNALPAKQTNSRALTGTSRVENELCCPPAACMIMKFAIILQY